MKTMYLLWFVLFILGNNVFALGETNCYNEEGTIKRVEKEVFGENRVIWLIHENMNIPEHLEVIENNLEILNEKTIAGSLRKIYKVQIEISRNDSSPLYFVQSNCNRCNTLTPVYKITDTVTCNQWSNLARE